MTMGVVAVAGMTMVLMVEGVDEIAAVVVGRWVVHEDDLTESRGIMGGQGRWGCTEL